MLMCTWCLAHPRPVEKADGLDGTGYFSCANCKAEDRRRMRKAFPRMIARWKREDEARGAKRG